MLEEKQILFSDGWLHDRTRTRKAGEEIQLQFRSSSVPHVHQSREFGDEFGWRQSRRHL